MQFSLPLSATERFDKASVCIENDGKQYSIVAELAKTPQQRSQGLMGRESLAEGHGMLFIYSTERRRGFWMFRTLIPLEIAYISAEGIVNEIHRMTPCTASIAALCPSYASAQPFLTALEMEAGQFSRFGVQPGARVTQGDCQ